VPEGLEAVRAGDGVGLNWINGWEMGRPSPDDFLLCFLLAYSLAGQININLTCMSGLACSFS
jgi:hypothetical protein